MRLLKLGDDKNSTHKIIRISFLFFCLGFYAFTCSKSVGWIDAPMHINNVYTLKLGSWVNIHNLFSLLGRIWTYLLPLNNFAYRVNLFCAFCGAVTVYFIFRSGLEITGNYAASVLGGIALLFSHTLWWYSTTTKIYTLNTALLSLTVYFVVKFNKTKETRELLFASFFFGLSCSNHVLMWLFIIPFLGVLYLPEEKNILRNNKTLFYMLLSFLGGFQLYLIFFLKEFNTHLIALNTPAPTASAVFSVLSETMHKATGGFFKQYMFPRYNAPFIDAFKAYLRWHLNYFLILVMNYPSPALLAGFIGIFSFWKNKNWRFSFWFVFLGASANTIWAINYHIWDQSAFGLPSWVLFGLFIILGLDNLFKKFKPRLFFIVLGAATLLCGPFVYSQIPKWGKQPGFWKNYFGYFRFTSNFWDAAEYFGNPDKRNYALPEKIAESIFDKLPPGAVFYDSDGKGYYPLKYYFHDIYNMRPDIEHIQFFGPTATEEEALKDAQRIITQINEGKNVFIASIYWPESVILKHLYILSENKSSEQDLMEASQLSPEDLVGRFKSYKIKKIPLLKETPYCIYQIEK